MDEQGAAEKSREQLERELEIARQRIAELERSALGLSPAGTVASGLLLQQLLLDLPAAVAVLDDRLRYLLVSNRWRRDYRVGERDLRGLSHFDLFPKQVERWRRIFRRVLSGSIERGDEELLELADGGADWVRWELQPWRNPAGQVVGVLMFSELVTEQKHAARELANSRQELLEAERRYRVVADWTYDLELWVSPQGTPLYVSPSAQRITGFSAEELLSGAVALLDVVHPEDRQRVDEHLRQALEGGAANDVEWRVVRRDGATTWVSASWQPARLDDGRFLGFRMSIRDIADRKRAEQLLLESQEQRFRNLVETSDDLIWELDRQGRYTYLSPRVHGLLGFEPEQLLGRHIGESMPPEEAERFGRFFAGMAADRRSFVCVENENRHRDGRTVILETSGVPFFGADGELAGYRGSSRDVTERKRVERFREEYLGLVSHDLRAPLNVVVGRAGMLQRRLAAEGLSKEASGAESILRNGQRMEAMIQDLVESVRLESGTMPIRRAPTDLRALVADALGRLGADEDRERLRLEDGPALPPVVLDSERVERVLANLVTNALKYATPGTPVLLKVERRGAEAVVSVSDRGPGIAPEELPLLFERFSRTRTGRAGAGLGLGLYISRLIVEAHGGRIWAESEVGQGSTFAFALPLGSGEKRAEPGASP